MLPLDVPSFVNDSINQSLKSSNEEFVKFTEAVMQCVQQNECRNINLQAFANKLSISLEEIEDMFGILLQIIKWCQQLGSHSDKEIRSDLIEHGFSGETANNIVLLIANKLNKRNLCSDFGVHIVKFNWRIDISFQNSMKRIISPTVIWHITLSNGRQLTIEISIKKFQEIRFHITSLLNSMRRTRYQMQRS